ncbi:MAG: O-antigen ligase family protein [Parvibaculaceae bacterium]
MDGWNTYELPKQQSEHKSSLWSERVGDVLMFLVIFSSFYQQSTPGESKPVLFDLMLILAMGVFFGFGLKFPKGLLWPVALWGAVLAGYGIGGMRAEYTDKVTSFLQVATYLTCAFIFFTSYVFVDPERRMRLIFNGYTAGATVAALAGIAGYFGIGLGGLQLTTYGRASGTFNDPNVFGPYLVAPAVYLGLRLSKSNGWSTIVIVPLFGILVLGILLSFSRGAWGSFLLSAILFFGFTMATSQSGAQVRRLMALGGIVGLLLVGIVGVALSTPKIQALFEERASLVQNYDVGQGGRFTSQQKALEMGLTNPLGIGPQQWAMINKLDTHNVYLNVFVAGGFISLMGFLGFLGLTFFAGKRALYVNAPGQDYLIVAYVCLIGHMGEAFIIDVDNWRHLFLLFGITWGGILAAKAYAAAPPRRTKRTNAQPVSGFTA